MKKIIKIFSVEFFGLYVVNSNISGLFFANKFEGLIFTAAALAVATTLIRPLINVLILPITLATMGLLKFLSHAVTLYIVDLALDQFKVEYFDFAGFHSQYLDLPAVHFNGGIFAYIGFSLVISVITGFVHWLMK